MFISKGVKKISFKSEFDLKSFFKGLLKDMELADNNNYLYIILNTILWLFFLGNAYSDIQHHNNPFSNFSYYLIISQWALLHGWQKSKAGKKEAELLMEEKEQRVKVRKSIL